MYRKYGRARNGQIIIFTALVMALLLLSVAATIYYGITVYRRVRSEYIQGVIDNINTEFDKVLTYILSSATHKYNITAEMNTPRLDAYTKFTFWVKSLIHQLSEMGVKINISLPNIYLQPEKTIFGEYHLNERHVYDLFKLYWYSPQSLSAIAANIKVDVPSIGLYGWNKTVLLLLNATVFVDKIHSDNSATYVNILVNKENNIPVENLDRSSFEVMYYEPLLDKWVNAVISRVENNGGGNYTLLLNRVEEAGGGALPSASEKALLIWVEDDRGIIVELYTYDHIDYVVRENAINQFYPGANKTYEKYVFEVLQNGTWLWLNKPIPMPYTPPIPIPPVKQIRVYSTVNGYNDPNMVEIPSQVEVWSKDYKKPTLRFADWRKRFSRGDKLVFIVSFAKPNVTMQKVRIKWLHDADVSPPKYLIHFTIALPYFYVNNSVYVLQLVANPGYSDWIDWSISVHWKNYHVEYTLYGYDVYRMSNGYWFPMKLPGGNWTLLVGPIRAIAYRENNLVVIPPEKNETYDELYHIELIEIPYGVHYFLYFGYFKWIKDVTLDYRYLTLFGEVSGTKNDTNSPLRLKYGSLQLEDSSQYVTGNYTIYGIWPWNIMHRDRRYNDAGNFGYWISQYNENNGQIIFIDEKTYSLLKSHEYQDYSQVWAWSTYDYARRVLEYDLLYWDPNARYYTISNNTEMNIFFAGFVYDGGKVYYPYKDWSVWMYYSYYDYIYAFDKSDGAVIPQMYYRMFLESYAPDIESIGT